MDSQRDNEAAGITPEEEVSGNISLEDILRALVNESVRSRIRHRVLLEILSAAGVIRLSDYVARYKKEEEESFSILLDQLLGDPEVFAKKHRVWLAQDLNKFGFVQTAVPGVSLTDPTESTADQAEKRNTMESDRAESPSRHRKS